MNTDTTNTDALSVDPADDDGPKVHSRTANLQITHRKECKSPLCHNRAAIGSDYCTGCRPDGDPLGGITNPQPTPDPTPSRRDLQRQLDRIEGKLDALLNEDD